MTGAPLLSLDGVSLSFAGVTALNALSFDVAPGEICALIGPNGAGKSSLLNVINGVYRADAGEVRFAGERLLAKRRGDAAHLGIGRTFQHNALFGRLSVIENVMAGLAREGRAGFFEAVFHLGRDREERRRFRERAERALAFLGLSGEADRVVSTLSYGTQKRVDLARALMTKPRLVLLDEPSMGLAPIVVQEIFEIVRSLNTQSGASFLVAEQNANLALRYAAYAYVLETGRVAAEGTAADLLSRGDIHDLYFGGSSGSVALH